MYRSSGLEVLGARPATLLKKRLQHRCFPMNFVMLLKEYLFLNRTPPVASSETFTFHLKTLYFTFLFMLNLQESHMLLFPLKLINTLAMLAPRPQLEIALLLNINDN